MADTMDDAAFWLPSHFLTDSDDYFNDVISTDTAALFGIQPSNSRFFPKYGASGSALDSPVSSEEGMTEPVDHDEFLAELTRQLARSSLHHHHHHHYSRDNNPLEMATSPQSTLAGYARWANRSGDVSPISNYYSGKSPPPTPPSDTWDHVYAAAVQLAKMKAAAAAQEYHQLNKGLLGPPRSHPLRSSSLSSISKGPTVNGGLLPQYPLSNNNVHQGVVGHCGLQHQRQQILRKSRCGVGGFCAGCGGDGGGRGGGGALGLPPSAWPPLRPGHRSPHSGPEAAVQHLHSGGVGCAMGSSFPGVGMKRQSAGTGVFLPRRYDALSAEPRKKQGCSTVVLPARVVQALNLNFNLEEPNPRSDLRQQSLVPVHEEVMMARRNAAAAAAAWAQQRRNLMSNAAAAVERRPLNHEIRLPQEWTY